MRWINHQLLLLAFLAGANAFVNTHLPVRARLGSAQSTVAPKTPAAPCFLSNDSNVERGEQSKLPMLLDPGTKGGALFLSLVLFVVPLLGYQFVTSVLGVDGIEAGKWIGVGFTFATLILWVSTYIFRVATKDMTYVSFTTSSTKLQQQTYNSALRQSSSKTMKMPSLQRDWKNSTKTKFKRWWKISNGTTSKSSCRRNSSRL